MKEKNGQTLFGFVRKTETPFPINKLMETFFSRQNKDAFCVLFFGKEDSSVLPDSHITKKKPSFLLLIFLPK